MRSSGRLRRPVRASLLLGVLICGLVIVCFLVKINPDNVATPIAASLGDLFMLVVLAGLSSALYYTAGE